jgi:hypothetical protein
MEVTGLRQVPVLIQYEAVWTDLEKRKSVLCRDSSPSVRVCILALIVRQAKRVCVVLCVICGLSASTVFFPHYLINGTIFGKQF